MTPELQNLLNAQQEAAQQASDVSMHFKFLPYSTFAAMIICAVFSVLIFWKLCQIHRGLRGHSMMRPDPLRVPTTSSSGSSFPMQSAAEDDTQYMPKE
jgi:hypothetical protein